MPILGNPHYELAAQMIASGKPKEEAAIIGGLDPLGSSFAANARKFCQKHGIPRRVAEIQAIAARCAAIRAEHLIIDAEEARLKAMRERGGASAAVAAIICKAKLSGIAYERAEITGANGTPFIPMSDAERARALASFMAKTQGAMPTAGVTGL
jgi:hypothetical protein